MLIPCNPDFGVNYILHVQKDSKLLHKLVWFILSIFVALPKWESFLQSLECFLWGTQNSRVADL